MEVYACMGDYSQWVPVCIHVRVVWRLLRDMKRSSLYSQAVKRRFQRPEGRAQMREIIVGGV
jgi:hypothetical protein